MTVKRGLLLGLLALSAAVVGVVLADDTAIPNSDTMLDYQTEVVYGMILKMSPSSFDATAFMAALYTALSASLPTLASSDLQLMEWCAWANATYIAFPAGDTYCKFGASDTVEGYSSMEYVLVSFRCFASTATSLLGKTLTLASPYNSIAAQPTRSSVDSAFYNPDDFTTIENDTGVFSEVYHNSVAFWAIFGCLCGIVVLAIVALVACRCYRDRKQAERNRDLVHGAVHKYRLDLRSFFSLRSHHDHNDAAGGADGGRHSRRHKFGKKSRRYDDVDGAGTQDRYNLAGGPPGEFGDASTHDSALPTSRASMYWPGSDSPTGGRPANATNSSTSSNPNTTSASNWRAVGGDGSPLTNNADAGDREMENLRRDAQANAADSKRFSY